MVVMEPGGRNKEVRSYRLHIHPKWDGDYDSGYDAAIVELPQNYACNCSVEAFPNATHVPPLADPNLDIYPNMPLYAFSSDVNGRLMTAQFLAISKDKCSNRTQMWGDRLLCVWSPAAEVSKGISGGPLILYGHRLVWNATERKPDLDVIAALAVASSSDTRSPKGTMSVIMITSLHEWISRVVQPESMKVYEPSRIGILGGLGGIAGVLVAFVAILWSLRAARSRIQIRLVANILWWAIVTVLISIFWLAILARLRFLANGFYAFVGLPHRNPLL